MQTLAAAMGIYEILKPGVIGSCLIQMLLSDRSGKITPQPEGASSPVTALNFIEYPSELVLENSCPVYQLRELQSRDKPPSNYFNLQLPLSVNFLATTMLLLLFIP